MDLDAVSLGEAHKRQHFGFSLVHKRRELAELRAQLIGHGAPLLAGSDGYVTGASARNWASYGDEVRLAPELSGEDRALLCDPQTSGGLLVACRDEAVPDVVQAFERHGCARAAEIGVMTEGAPIVRVDP